jgi:hypothetical protein
LILNGAVPPARNRRRYFTAEGTEPMAARDVYNTAVATAATAKKATYISAAQTFNNAIAGSPSQATIRSAYATYVATLQAANAAEQGAHDAAKDTLRATGDVGPA